MGTQVDPPIDEILNLHKCNDYEGILLKLQDVCSRRDPVEVTNLRALLWPVPTETDLCILAGFTLSRGVGHIYSVGCGTALLEYLLLAYIQDEARARLEDSLIEQEGTREVAGQSQDNGQRMEGQSQGHGESQDSVPGFTGVEIDSAWWTSKYAPPLFLPLLYIGETFFKDATFGSPSDLVIFSYFNSIETFKDYLARFNGAYVVVIGPMKKQFCAPNPMDLKDNPNLPNSDWNLILFQRFGLEEVDYLGIYERAS